MGEIILICTDVVFAETLITLGASSDAVVFAERSPARWLDESELADGIRLSAYETAMRLDSWEAGRIFCDRWELRWEKSRAVYTGEPTGLAGFSLGPDISSCTRVENSFYLWGKRDGNRFIELRIPRVLIYPVDGGARVKLRVAEWFDAAGRLVASRCLRLEGAQ
jgi:hypothetical protein